MAGSVALSAFLVAAGCYLAVYGDVSINCPQTPVTIGDEIELICSITSFSGTASWRKDGSSQTTCTPTFCTVSSNGNYTYKSDANGISLTISYVSAAETHLWQCSFNTESDSCTLSPTEKTSTTTTQTTTPFSHSPSSTGHRTTTQRNSGLSDKWKYGLFGALGFLVVIAIFIGLYCWRHHKHTKEKGNKYSNESIRTADTRDSIKNKSTIQSNLPNKPEYEKNTNVYYKKGNNENDINHL